MATVYVKDFVKHFCLINLPWTCFMLVVLVSTCILWLKINCSM